MLKILLFYDYDDSILSKNILLLTIFFLVGKWISSLSNEEVLINDLLIYLLLLNMNVEHALASKRLNEKE